MSIRPKTALRAALLASLGTVALAACGESNNGVVFMPPAPPPAPPPPAMGAAVYGSGFAAAFNADATADPVDPMDGDIIALDKTIDPNDASAT